MARLAKAYVFGQPFQSKRAAKRMVDAVNARTRPLRAALDGLKITVLHPHNSTAVISGPWPTIMALFNFLEPSVERQDDGSSSDDGGG